MIQKKKHEQIEPQATQEMPIGGGHFHRVQRFGMNLQSEGRN
jgi:hypothetical protein